MFDSLCPPNKACSGYCVSGSTHALGACSVGSSPTTPNKLASLRGGRVVEGDGL